MDTLPWTNVQIQCYTDAFNLLDDDHDGKISIIQLKKVLEKLNHDVTDEEVKEWITKVCGDECEDIDIDQFLSLMSTKQLVRQTSVVSSGKHFQPEICFRV